jgi:hypothetical protein
MDGYNVRRHAHFIKLAICVAASRHDKLVLTLEDLKTAQEYLLDAERFMPQIVAQLGLSDSGRLVQNIRDYVDKQWKASDEEWPVSIDKTKEFALRTSKSAAEVDQVLRAMVEADIIKLINQNTVDGYCPGDNSISDGKQET